MNKVKEIYQNIICKTKKDSGAVTKIKPQMQKSVIDGYEKILQDWLTEEIKPSTKAAKRAICEVFDAKTPQEDWSLVEWTVYITKTIMYRADCVNVYDLYLLHEIMMRCQEDV